jgi:hypothetical protein
MPAKQNDKHIFERGDTYACHKEMECLEVRRNWGDKICSTEIG